MDGNPLFFAANVWHIVHVLPYALHKRPFVDVVRDTLADGAGSAIKIAEKSGLKRDAIRAVLRGQVPSIDRAAEICNALGLEFYVGPPRQAERETAGKIDQWRSHSGVIAYPVEAAEITGAASPSGCMLFTATFLRKAGLDPTQLLAIEVDNDDMAPVLPVGGCAVADRRKRKIEPGSIFALERPDSKAPLLRRAAAPAAGGWEFRCDRPDMPAVRNVAEKDLIGKVVWASRMDFELPPSPWQH